MVPVSPGHLSYSTIVHGDTVWSCRSWTVSLKTEQEQSRGQGRYVEVLTLWDLWKSPNVEVESATINLQCQLDWIESHLGEIPLTYLWKYIESTSQKWKTLLHVSRLIPWSWILSWFKKKKKRKEEKTNWSVIFFIFASWSMPWTKIIWLYAFHDHNGMGVFLLSVSLNTSFLNVFNQHTNTKSLQTWPLLLINMVPMLMIDVTEEREVGKTSRVGLSSSKQRLAEACWEPPEPKWNLSESFLKVQSVPLWIVQV